MYCAAFSIDFSIIGDCGAVEKPPRAVADRQKEGLYRGWKGGGGTVPFLSDLVEKVGENHWDRQRFLRPAPETDPVPGFRRSYRIRVFQQPHCP